MKLLTTRQVAEKTGYTVGYIRQLARQGDIPHMKLSHRALRFDEKKIEEWIQLRTRTVFALEQRESA